MQQFFLQFIEFLIQTGVLQAGYYFILDNCTLHFQDDKIGLEETLKTIFNITLILLHAYHPEYNPTELISQLLFQRMRTNTSRYNTLSNADFVIEIKKEIATFDLLDVVKNYMSQGYLQS